MSRKIRLFDDEHIARLEAIISKDAGKPMQIDRAALRKQAADAERLAVEKTRPTEETTMEKRARVSFTDVILEPVAKAAPPTDAARVFPLEQQRRGDLGGADEGADALGRSYADEVLARLGGNPKLPGWEGDTRDIAYRPAQFHADGGGELAKAPPMYADQVLGSSGPVRLGPGWVLNPINAGIADPAGFQAPAPRTEVLKRRKTGMFRDIVTGPLDGTNFFDQGE